MFLEKVKALFPETAGEVMTENVIAMLDIVADADKAIEDAREATRLAEKSIESMKSEVENLRRENDSLRDINIKALLNATGEPTVKEEVEEKQEEEKGDMKTLAEILEEGVTING